MGAGGFREFQVEGLQVLHAPASGQGARAFAAGRPPVLLVHGAGHGAWCWELWMPALAQAGWESFALSLRNHGGEGPGLRTVDRGTFLRRLKIEDYADDVAAVVRHIARPLIVAGHSMGGIVVQRCVARFGAAEAAHGAPSPIRAMVLLASVTPGSFGPLRPGPLPVDQPYRPDAATAQARYFHTAPQAVVDAAVARMVDESPSAMNDYSLSPGVAVEPRHVRCPVLAVTAGHDGTTVARDGRLAQFYRGTHLPIPTEGHDLMLEAGWLAVLDQILAWLERAPGE